MQLLSGQAKDAPEMEGQEDEERTAVLLAKPPPDAFKAPQDAPGGTAPAENTEQAEAIRTRLLQVTARFDKMSSQSLGFSSAEEPKEEEDQTMEPKEENGMDDAVKDEGQNISILCTSLLRENVLPHTPART